MHTGKTLYGGPLGKSTGDLTYLSPIIDGVGTFSVEEQTRDRRRMDVMIHTPGEKVYDRTEDLAWSEQKSRRGTTDHRIYGTLWPDRRLYAEL